MLHRTGANSVASDEGWRIGPDSAARQQGDDPRVPTVLYCDEAERRLIVHLHLHFADEPDGRTTVSPAIHDWRWNGDGEPISPAQRHIVIERVRAAYMHLGYDVCLAEIEINAGLREREPRATDVEPHADLQSNTLVYESSLWGRRLEATFVRQDDHCEIPGNALTHWSPPHDTEAIAPEVRRMVMAAWSRLMQSHGLTLAFV